MATELARLSNGRTEVQPAVMNVASSDDDDVGDDCTGTILFARRRKSVRQPAGHRMVPGGTKYDVLVPRPEVCSE